MIKREDKLMSTIAVLGGTFLLAVSVTYFVLPYDILSGGCAGVAVILNQAYGFNERLVIDILTIAFFVIGALVLGRDFALKTVLSSLVYPVFLALLSLVPYDLGIDRLTAAIYGGVVAGLGLGWVFRYNASTGGTDVPALILHKYTGIPEGTLTIITDGLIALVGIVVFDVQSVCYGILYVYIGGVIINKVMVPIRGRAVALYIITTRQDEIVRYIQQELSRGTTIIPAKGGYTGEDRQVILTVVSVLQYSQLSDEIERIDPKAFVIVSETKDMIGEGFTYELRV